MLDTADLPSSAESGGEQVSFRIRAACPDGPGIVSALAVPVARLGANIRESNQFTTDPRSGRFFIRLVVDVPASNQGELLAQLEAIAHELKMDLDVWPVAKRKRMALMCSTADHCVLDLLWRAQTGDLDVEIPVVISNHDKLRRQVEAFDVPFVHVPATPANRRDAERRILAHLVAARVDLVVMARYMQILTDDFLLDLDLPVINIHHSLLPAFIGAEPYRRAYERGVKIIGATAHYATPDLDEGPIISQGVEDVEHTDNAADLQRRGKNIERTVLAEAVALHVEDRVHVHENRTIIHV